ncbi:protein-disulfide isomerase [Sphingomonas oleivorans]|uniref:Protein-disulfide isomerase n=1 Tax=Sphingomonas oleivorans TaxID=1735121 RepID=A0A2T5FXP1_9SPHN|nr:thioredoxin domain-containing protein [Sphingomonas oleivorans]PTQ10917.1 protein-disulfide isomerase [Sphingomonas oleivorans]
MRLAAAIGLALAALGAALGPIASAPIAAAPAKQDWSKVASRTASGSFLLGNPAAKVKLVEYLSLSCSHCAHFAGEAMAPLKAGYIRTGLVSLEVRHALRDPFDLTAVLLARCDGPASYFPAAEAVFARQEEWIARAQTYVEKDPRTLSAADRLVGFAEGSGLDALFRARGMAPARIRACLGDPAQQKLLADMADEAWNGRKIGGTPAFLINGVAQEGVGSWADLEPKLKAALK